MSVFFLCTAESAYEQYRNLHDKKLDEAEDEREQRQRNVSKKYVCVRMFLLDNSNHSNLNLQNRKRMLKLELTDGHDTVIAMEHCPISCLSTKLYPGTKILIKGNLS